tara:strand:- start:71 stop:1261 length:1191 start_codon:yes stop_codon:yes gene_type:complete
MSNFNIGSTIFTKLSNDTTLTGYVGTAPVRIFPDVAPLNVAQTFPYVVYSIVSDVPTNTKGPTDPGDPVAGGPQTERSPLNIMRIQISSFANDYSTSMIVANRIRTILDRGIGSGFTVGSGPDIDSIVYDGMTTNYESNIKPQGVYEVSQEYIVRTINTDIAPSFSNVYSLNFDGVDDYLQLGDQNIFSFGNGTTDSPFSISYWIKPQTVAAGTGIFGKESSVSTREYSAMFSYNNVRIRLWDNVNGGHLTLGSANPLSVNVWHHIVMTYDGSGNDTGLKIYVNASIPAQSTASSGTYVAMSNTAADFTIGAVFGSYFYEGNMDEFSMFNIELTAAQVLAIYNAGTPTNLTSHDGLIGWWRMGDSGAYPLINDSSTNTNNATMTNMVASDIENLVP